MIHNDEEIHCPKCESDSDIRVQFTGTCRLTRHGSEDDGDHEYDTDAPTQCGACGHFGTLADFTHEEEGEDADPELAAHNAKMTEAVRAGLI